MFIGFLAIPPAIAFWARAQSDFKPDLADRVLRGAKAPKSASASQAGPKDTDELLVRLKPGADPLDLADRHGLEPLRRLTSDSDWAVFRAPGAARQFLAALRSDPDVQAAGVNQQTAYKRFGFTPNDPYFQPNAPTIGWQGEWHLENQLGGSVDANVKPAWDSNWTGSGVVIGIVDDCLEKAHPDLSPNFSTSHSWDFGQNDSDPSPVYATDMHGTSVAGVAAARGGNGIGITGAAPFSKLAGLRVDFNTQTTQEFVDATLYHSSNGNTGIKIKNHSYGYTTPFITTDLERQALAQSAASGTIHAFAAGNERGFSAEDSNSLDLQSSPDSITVAALGEDGTFASYSSFGSNVFVTAPSNSDGLPTILTTDVTGASGYNPDEDTFPDQSYVSIFGGTSSATPLVSGVLALAKQACPSMDERLAKHLLVRSARKVDLADTSAASGGGWVTNGAGFSFDENYGFGCIDAGALVKQALKYQGVTKLQTETVGPVTVGKAIPDNDPTGLSQTFNVQSATPLEEVTLGIDITHPYRGDLEIWLKSPSGTWSRLKSTVLGGTPTTSDSGANIHWTFCSNAFWGESPSGTWTLLVKDLAAGDVGTLDDFTFAARMGTPILRDNAKFVAQNVLNSMVAGQTYPVTIQFQNNGYSTWTKPGWYLRSENPSANTSWGFSTVNLASTDSISPGSSKSFSFKVYAPTTSGTYDFEWRMRHSGFTSFGDYSVDVPVTVTVMPDAARFVSMTGAPSSVPAGASFPVSVTLTNVGTNTWTGGSPYCLKALTSSTKWGNSMVPVNPAETIPPGSSKTFTFTAVAPTTPGKYVMQWQMANGATVFGDRTPAPSITVLSS